MTRKITSIDIDDLVARYRAGEDTNQLATTLGVSSAWVRNKIRDAGAARRGERPETTEKIAGAIAMREQGMTQREIGEHFGVGQAVISRWLLSRGMRADLSESMRKRLASMSPAERQALAAAAHDAVRGTKQPHSQLVKRAAANEVSKVHATDEETAIAEALTVRGLAPITQQAVDKYNLDIGVAPVAVELFGGGWHAHGRHAARLPQRLKDIADAGYNMLIVWTHHVHPLNIPVVADDILAYHEFASSNPTARRQYRVVWGDGKFIASGCVDDDDLAVIPAGIRGAYASGR